MAVAKALSIAVVEPALSAIVAGTLLGMGTLAFVRHGTGVGGIGILAVWLSRKYGWNIGRTQFLMDLIILASWSTLSAATMGIITGLRLRPDRYSGFSPHSFQMTAAKDDWS